MLIDHGNFGVHHTRMVFMDLNPCIEKTAIKGMRGILQQSMIPSFPATAKRPGHRARLHPKAHDENSIRAKIGICKNNFELRLFDRLQIGIFNITAMADVVPDQKSQAFSPYGFG
jgi:hypothetical protein